MTHTEFLSKLTNPPMLSLLDGENLKAVKRVAKVRMTWNEQAKAWDFDGIEGLSTYTEVVSKPKKRERLA